MNFQLLADIILKGIDEVKQKGTSSFYVSGPPVNWCEVEVKLYTGEHGEYISIWIMDRIVSAHSFARTEK